MGAAAERVRALLELVAHATGADAEVEVAETEAGIAASFQGDDLGLLIGQRGHTIDAIQHLAYRAAGNGSGERVPVSVDAGGYRRRRAEALCADADRAAVTAMGEGRPVALEAMSAPERKVVHEHLRGRTGIETYSEGEEPARHLVVAPVV